MKGLQVSPAELEATLGENPHIEDVAVVGIATYVFLVDAQCSI